MHDILFYMVLICFTFVVRLNGKEVVETKHPPCFFNSLCTCSKIVPDLGIVRCQDVKFAKIPSMVNNSKVFMLHMDNNGLRRLEPHFLQNTGLYKLTIRQNLLYNIVDEAFSGLERSLSQLDLSDNRLRKVPNRAIRYLQKLKLLNLDGNDIYEIRPDSWRGLETSLETLILANNVIKVLPIDAFSGLPHLEILDLTGNNLREIDANVFRDGMQKLGQLILADNLLTNIPYEAVQPLEALKKLDLSNNLINTMKLSSEMDDDDDDDNKNSDEKAPNIRISLDELRLEDNEISVLQPGAFQFFDILNKTYLDHNKINTLSSDAFRVAKIKELYLRTCGLKEINPEMFNGLEATLEILDLSGNDLETLEENEFTHLEHLQSLNLDENEFVQLNPLEAFNGLQFTLHHLDLSGSFKADIALQDLKRLRNLRSLSLSRLKDSELSEEDFADFGVDLSDFTLTLSNVHTIKKNAFKHIHGLKKIDFSENNLKAIENDAFHDIGHSLQSLTMSKAFSSSMTRIPAEALRPLVELQELDLSNNKFKTMPDSSFYFLKKLKVLELQDNEIDAVHKGTFQGDIHSNLQKVYFSFNNIKKIEQHTFVDLESLEQLLLDDNEIELIERRAFMNLEDLKRLNLKGNEISSIAFEAFQNLPELEDLDLSYNNLPVFEFQIFDQVGTLGILKTNLSHNKISDLVVGSGNGLENGLAGLHSNIKTLDLSFNNISFVPKKFFQPAIMSLTHLHLAHNSILNATKDAFGNLPHLEWLDLSHNDIEEINFDVFRNTRKLQVFLVSHNEIVELPSDLFRYMMNLRVVDLSDNKIKFLPENLFKEEGLEQLDLSNNNLHRMPLSSMSPLAAATLCELDLSGNNIPAIGDNGLFSKFKSLSVLDLSYNKLVELDSGVFGALSALSSLDLSHNSQLMLDRKGSTFDGIEDTLTHLKLDNVSLAYVPELNLPNLLSLSLAKNSLPTIPPEMAHNITLLREFNLEFNDLTSIPIVTYSLKELQKLDLANNPIVTLSNTSLLGVAEHLEELDIANLELDIFEEGAISNVEMLRTLRMSVYEIPDFNIPEILLENTALRHLEVHLDDLSTNLAAEMNGDLPPKLSSVAFSGNALKNIDKRVLKGIKNPDLHVAFKNTSLASIPAELFGNIGTARDLTIEIVDNKNLGLIENPSSGRKPDLPDKQFLLDMIIDGNKLNCDCSIGWVEIWLRKKRQYICGSSPSSPISYNHPSYTCRHPPDHLRNQICLNKNNKTLLEVLKSDIECGWNNANANNNHITFNAISLIILTIFITITMH